MNKSFNWHNLNKTTYIYCSDDDWNHDDEHAEHDWGNVIFDDDSNCWLSW